jgi:hypothetical protein
VSRFIYGPVLGLALTLGSWPGTGLGAAPAASATPPTSCAATFDEALRRQEAVRPHRRLTPVLRAVVECTALSRPLRDAASELRKVAKPPSRVGLCPKAGAVANAVELMARCPIPEIVRPAVQAVRFMHPAHYELLWALAIELQRQGTLLPTARRVVLNGLLAAAQLGERPHEHTP